VTQKLLALGLVLVAIGLIGFVILTFFQSGVYSIDSALTISERYRASLNNPNIAIGEIMEFEQNFYVVYYEKSTGLGAFEMLIDKRTGRIFPEYGPNMMWNTKYGHGAMMGGWSQIPSGQIPIDHDEAVLIAQEVLDHSYLGTITEDTHRFYGYYTVHVAKDGEIFGMLSVNGYDGAVWYHNWHGSYIQSREIHEE